MLDARQKLQEIAARDLGGSPSDYEIGGERVYRRGNRSQGLSFVRAAQRAIDLGGTYDGHELPEDINGMTTASATALAGQGLMGVAKDNFAEGGRRMSFVAGFAEVEVDVETGDIRMVDYAAGCDAGTIIHPKAFEGQVFGGAIQGFSVALSQKWVYDRRWGLLVAKRFYNNRPPGILDVPHEQPMKWGAADLPDPVQPARREGHRRGGAGRRVGCRRQRHRGCVGAGERRLLPVAGDTRHDSDAARAGSDRPQSADGSRLRKGRRQPWP